MSPLWFLSGFLPFVSYGRVGPIASFWPQWSAATIFFLLTTSILLKNRKSENLFYKNFFDMPIVLLIFCILMQIYLSHVYSKASACLALSVLLLGWIFSKVSSPIMQAKPEESLEPWCMGVVAALVFQTMIVCLGLLGKDLVYGELLDVPMQLRAIGAFGQSNHLGVFSVLSLACVYYVYLKGKISNILVWIFVLFSAFNCALSFSRAALLAWLALVILGALPLWKLRKEDESRNGWKIYRNTSLFFLAVQLLNYFVPFMPLFTEAQNGNALLSEGRDFSVNARWEQIRDSFQIIFKYPYFGVGYEGFAGVRLKELHSSLAEPEVTVPHNLLLQMLVELGLVGGVLGVWLTFSLWKAARPLFYSEYCPEGHMLALQWVSGLYIYSLIEFPLLYSYFLLPFLMMAGLCGLHHAKPIVIAANKIRLGLYCLTVTGFLFLYWVAWDYHRLYKFFHGRPSIHVIQANQKAVLQMELAKIQSSSWFQFHANFIWLNVIALNDLFAEEKMKISDFVVRGVPQYQTIAKYVTCLVLVGEEKHALAFIKEFSHRSPGAFRNAYIEMKRLSEMPGSSPSLGAFLKNNFSPE